MRFLSILILACGLLSSCKPEAAMKDDLSVAEAEAMIAGTKDLQVIDVRTPGEYKGGHLKNARLIPIDDFDARLAEIDKDKPALLYCASGGRSEIALDTLKKAGYKKAVHMSAGFDAWRKAEKIFEK
jgi:thioredoxin 1